MHRTVLAALTAVVCATSVVSAAGPKPAPKAANESSVTLTGCLHANGSRFLLTDLQGVNVPKSRSWKSGYLKKSSKRYEVVSASSGMKLKDHVGHQVTVTGTAAGGTQLKARSIKHISGSCS